MSDVSDLLFVAAHRSHRRPSLRQLPGDLTTYARCRAGDNDTSTLELHERLPSAPPRETVAIACQVPL